MDRASAASAISMGLVGQAVGAPLMGWVSDTIRRRKLPMMVGLLLLAGSFLLIVYGPVLPVSMVYIVMFLMGVGNGASIIGFATAREKTPSAISGVTVACLNTAFMAGGAIMQPLSGWILDLYWDGTLVEGVRVYGPEVWKTAFLPFVAFCAAGIVGTALISETHCRPLEQQETP
jgi:MFS family permease